MFCCLAAFSKLKIKTKNYFRVAIMSSLPEATRNLMEVFNGKLQDFMNEVENVHMIWLGEIQQEAQRMFSR